MHGKGVRDEDGMILSKGRRLLRLFERNREKGEGAIWMWK